MKNKEIVLWMNSIALLLKAPTVMINREETIDLRMVNVNSKMIKAAHIMGWNVMYKISTPEVVDMSDKNDITTDLSLASFK